METKPFDISERQVAEAYQRVKANKGGAGVDKQSIEQFDQKLDNNLYKLWNRMASGSYFPPPVKAVPIAKKSGGERILGVPTVADRTAQAVATGVLVPLLEPVFHEDSYGYRPNRSAHQAIEVTQARCRRIDWVLESIGRRSGFVVCSITSIMPYCSKHCVDIHRRSGYCYMWSAG